MSYKQINRRRIHKRKILGPLQWRRVENKPQIPPISETGTPHYLQYNTKINNTSSVSPGKVAGHVKTLDSSGKELPANTKRFFESRFGKDFSQVRIHNDAQSAESARYLQARAYAKGNSIVFAQGQYAPNSYEGKRLLAHELTHVIQQTGKQASKKNLQQKLYRAKEDEAAGPQSKVITFIMGAAEKRGRRKFYKSAIKYWSVKGKTNVLVKDARTLADIFDHLLMNPPKDNKPWREVNIISHASEEGYLSFPIDDDARAAKENSFGHEQLAEAIAKGKINPLPNNIIGRSTNINIHGCALGRSRAMLKQLSKAFGGTDVYAPVIYAPKHLQSYKYSEKYRWKRVGRRRRRRRVLVKGTYTEYLREYWTVEYPTTRRVSRSRLRRDFEKKFGTDPKLPNWRRAVRGAERRIRTYWIGKKNDKSTGIKLKYVVLPRRNKQKDYLALLRKSDEGQAIYESWKADRKAWKRLKKSKKKEIKRLYRMMRKLRRKNPARYKVLRHEWQNLKTEYAQLRRFGVDHKTTQQNDKIKSAIEIFLHFHDETWRSMSYNYENPWVPRNRRREISKLVRQTVGNDVYKRHQWRVKKKVFGKWRIGNERTALFRGVGKRSVYRISRPLKDVSGALHRPSREESLHYGKYVPQHKYNVIIKGPNMIWVGGAEERARKSRIPSYLEPHGF